MHNCGDSRSFRVREPDVSIREAMDLKLFSDVIILCVLASPRKKKKKVGFNFKSTTAVLLCF